MSPGGTFVPRGGLAMVPADIPGLLNCYHPQFRGTILPYTIYALSIGDGWALATSCRQQREFALQDTLLPSPLPALLRIQSFFNVYHNCTIYNSPQFMVLCRQAL